VEADVVSAGNVFSLPADMESLFDNRSLSPTLKPAPPVLLSGFQSFDLNVTADMVVHPSFFHTLKPAPPSVEAHAVPARAPLSDDAVPAGPDDTHLNDNAYLRLGAMERVIENRLYRNLKRAQHSVEAHAIPAGLDSPHLNDTASSADLQSFSCTLKLAPHSVEVYGMNAAAGLPTEFLYRALGIIGGREFNTLIVRLFRPLPELAK
jgi:hypothetical protein